MARVIRIPTLLLCLLMCCPAFMNGAVQAASFDRANPAASLQKDFYTFFISLTLLLPELVEFNFDESGTVTITSDLWDGQAEGTYQKRPLRLKGDAESPRFFDGDLDEEIKMRYEFNALPLGFRRFFVLGNGIRTITWFSDNTISREFFMFLGPGT